MKILHEKKQIRVGIAGLGGIAKRTHLPVLNITPGVKVVCGAEKDGYQRERVASMYNIQAYEDYTDMIEKADIDALYVCLPATLHADAVTKALKKGLHVFCEKPMGLNAVDARMMVDQAIQSNRILMPGYNLRHVDNFVRAKRLIETGKLGKIIHVNALFLNPGPYISWDPKSDWYLESKSGGALYDIGSHIVDLLFFLFPHHIKDLDAYAVKGYSPYEAITNVVCSYRGEDGVLGTIQIGWRSASEVCSLEFHGTAGTLIVSRRNFSYTHGATDPADRITINATNIYREISAIMTKINMMRKGIDALNEFKEQAMEFINIIQTKNQNRADLENIIIVHKMLNAVELSCSKKISTV